MIICQGAGGGVALTLNESNQCPVALCVRYLGSDIDPLFLFQRWKANLEFWT